MKSLRPVRWKEGMFLRPHHLQQFDLYLETRETERLRAVETHAWGIVRFEVHTEALDNFALHVSELEAVFPDGTYVSVPANAQLPIRSFESQLTEPGRAVDVVLGLRAREERRSQVSPDGESTQQAVSRFQSIERDVYDIDAGEGNAPIEMLEYDLRLFFGSESTQGFDVMPLTQVQGTGDPARPVTIVKSFAPPAMSLRGGSALLDSARAVLEHISQVQRELSGRRAGDVDTAVLYQAVSGSKAVLRDMVKDGRVHPQRVYHEMARLAGALYFRDPQRGSSDDLPTYDHRRPGPVFERLRDEIRRLAWLTVSRQFERFPMQAQGDTFTLAPLPEVARKPGARLYLELTADASQPRLAGLMEAAKVSSAAQIETLKRYVLRGVPTERQPGPPPEVHDKPTASYFRLQHEHEDWARHVVAGGDLAVDILDAPSDISMSLIAIPPAGSEV